MTNYYQMIIKSLQKIVMKDTHFSIIPEKTAHFGDWLINLYYILHSALDQSSFSHIFQYYLVAQLFIRSIIHKSPKLPLVSDPLYVIMDEDIQEFHTNTVIVKHGFLSKNKNFLYTQAFSTVVWYVKPEYVFLFFFLSCRLTLPTRGSQICIFAL